MKCVSWKKCNPKNRTARGRLAEEAVCRWLRSNGLDAARTQYGAPFDIFCQGKRVEVKGAKFYPPTDSWYFVLSPSQTRTNKSDLFVLLLGPSDPKAEEIYLVIPSSEITRNFGISQKRLRSKWIMNINALWFFEEEAQLA